MLSQINTSFETQMLVMPSKGCHAHIIIIFSSLYRKVELRTSSGDVISIGNMYVYNIPGIYIVFF